MFLVCHGSSLTVYGKWWKWFLESGLELAHHTFGEKLGLWIVVRQQLIVEVGTNIVYISPAANHCRTSIKLFVSTANPSGPLTLSSSFLPVTLLSPICPISTPLLPSPLCPCNHVLTCICIYIPILEIHVERSGHGLYCCCLMLRPCCFDWVLGIWKQCC